VLDSTLECEPLTAAVGPNGSGKSSFLRALELFYSPRPAVRQEDFYNNDPSRDIEITITFTGLTDEAKARFGGYVQGEELTVTHVLFMRDGAPRSTLHGSRLQNPDFKPIRGAATATEVNRLYVELKRTEKYSGLPGARSRPAALEFLADWEQEHPEDNVRDRDEGQFFGFNEVAQGYLGRFTKLISVPAVRDATTDAAEGRGSAITELMDLVVRSTLAQREDIRQLREETQTRYREIVDAAATGSLQQLEGRLNTTLKSYVSDAAVQLAWLPPDEISIPQPRADVKLSEDGYAAAVERTGHGLQRAFILTMLQHLAVARPQSQEEQGGTETAKSEETVEATTDNTEAAVFPDLVLSIEEPELYQHPSRQRHLASILGQLANGTIAGVANRTQVIYATHSPLFVGIDRFHQVRIFRKVDGDPDKPRLTAVRSVDGNAIARELWEATDPQPPDVFTWETLEPRLRSILTPFMGEGFFADVAVLVEGEDDRAAILGCAHLMGHDLESRGIAVIPCGGKSNLDRPLVIFRSFGIRCFVLWDGDAGDPRAHPTENRRLLRLVGEAPEDWPDTKIKGTFACFKRTLEATLRQEIGDGLFHEVLGQCQTEFTIPKREHAQKNPVVIGELIRRSESRGGTCTTLRSIVESLIALRSA
jgi:energy-coupling factor transporter ATP-binding protein EcfA2